MMPVHGRRGGSAYEGQLGRVLDDLQLVTAPVERVHGGQAAQPQAALAQEIWLDDGRQSAAGRLQGGAS